MKNKILYDRFDAVMARLKTVEPSVSFDLGFRRKLDEALTETYAESSLALAIRRGIENLRYMFSPRALVLARAYATFIMVTTIGLCVYLAQEISLNVLHSEGMVLVKGIKDGGWVKITPLRKIKAGDMIFAKAGSQLDITLTDKYAIRIKDSSRLRVAKLTTRYGGSTALFELKDGEMLVSIEEGFKPSRFIVKTNAGSVKALGTKFSVDMSRKDRSRMNLSVLEGKVEVKSSYTPKKLLLAKQTVFVGSGQKTEVVSGEVPASPRRLSPEEWGKLEELYQIGKKPQVILLIKNTPDRVRQLLAPCPIYISDEKPRQIPKLLEEAVAKIEEAIKTNDLSKHYESIKILENIVASRSSPKYNAQLLLYIGAYYEYLSDHEKAIKAFERVVGECPGSPFASIAETAIGIIYDEKLNEKNKATEAFKSVLMNYPNTLEAIWVEYKLGIKKASNNT